MNLDELIATAKSARSRAYAPYSGYLVGSAVLDEKGRIHFGCNVENISYGGTICAERNAIGSMVANGGLAIKAIAVASPDGVPPCGICLQSIAEFGGPETQVHLIEDAGAVKSYRFSELLPLTFESDVVGRAN